MTRKENPAPRGNAGNRANPTGDDWRVCKDYVRSRLGQPASDPRHRP
jgi:hypothetical protein